MADGPLPWRAADGGVVLRVRAQPKASRNRVEGQVADAEGGRALKVAVTAPPADGKANAAIVKLLAKALGVPKSAFEVVQGATDRNKVLRIAGRPAEIEAALIRLAKGAKSTTGE